MTSSPEPALWALPDWSDDGADALGPAAPRPPARSGALAAVPAPAAWAPPEIAAAPAGAALVPDPRQARRAELEHAYQRGVADGARDGGARAEQRIRPAVEALARVAEYLEAARAEFARD